jgi:thioredoxin reductase (NADPH)
MLWDVIIIGGGPAGLTAGLYTARARLKGLLIEKGLTGGNVMTTEWIENYPGFEEGISGAELSQRMEKQARRFGLQIAQGSVVGIHMDGRIKKVMMDGDQHYETKSIILATGANPKRLGIEGEERFRGKGVSYCATCDGAFFKDEKIAVIGGGDAAVEEGMFLTRFAEIVYIIHRRDYLRATKIAQERASSNPKIKFILNSVVEEIDGDETVKSIHIKDVKTGERSVLDVGGVFIYVGYTPNTWFLKGVVELDENNYIVTDEMLSTSVPGIFAAGDVRSNSFKQVATAVGDGATAAIAAEKYIEKNFKE